MLMLVLVFVFDPGGDGPDGEPDPEVPPEPDVPPVPPLPDVPPEPVLPDVPPAASVEPLTADIEPLPLQVMV